MRSNIIVVQAVYSYTYRKINDEWVSTTNHSIIISDIERLCRYSPHMLQ